MSKKLNIAGISNDLEGSAFFPSKNTPPPSSTPATKPVTTSQSAQKKPISEAKPVKKPEIMKSGKPEKEPSPTTNFDKPEKYSTLMDANLIKKIKIHALEMDIKDYQVIELALKEYFKKN